MPQGRLHLARRSPHPAELGARGAHVGGGRLARVTRDLATGLAAAAVLGGCATLGRHPMSVPTARGGRVASVACGTRPAQSVALRSPARPRSARAGGLVRLTSGQVLAITGVGNPRDGALVIALPAPRPAGVLRLIAACAEPGVAGPWTYLFRAVHAGATSLDATGRPDCRAGRACPMFILDLRVEVQVS